MADKVDNLSESLFGVEKALIDFQKNLQSVNLYEQFAYGRGVSTKDSRLNTSNPRTDARTFQPADGELYFARTGINAKEVVCQFVPPCGKVLVYQSEFSTGLDGWNALSSTIGLQSAPTVLNADGSGIPSIAPSLRIEAVSASGTFARTTSPIFGNLREIGATYNICYLMQVPFGSAAIGQKAFFRQVIQSTTFTDVYQTLGLGVNKISGTFVLRGPNDDYRIGPDGSGNVGQVQYYKDILITKQLSENVQSDCRYLLFETAYQENELPPTLIGKNIKAVSGMLLPLDVGQFKMPVNSPVVRLTKIGLDNSGIITSQNQPDFIGSPNRYSIQFNGF